MESKREILRGFATINYWADDVAAAVEWYSELLGVQPFGNILGIMDNPHYREILASHGKA